VPLNQIARLHERVSDCPARHPHLTTANNFSRSAYQ
jgi:hypothetical protein